MKKTVRRGVFETNSSSVHAMTICDKADYDAWGRDEMLYHCYDRKLVPASDVHDADFPYPDGYDVYDKVYLTQQEFFEREGEYYETFLDMHTTANGDDVVVFGYYGHD